MSKVNGQILPDMVSDPRIRLGVARVAVQDLAVRAALATAARAQGYGSNVDGARAPIGPARGAVDLVEIVDRLGDDRVELMTPLGYRTARERLPRALSVLAPTDPRLHAAHRYRHITEKVGAVGSSSAGLLDAPTGRISDGGAVYRVGLARELAAHVALLGGIALAMGNARGDRRHISVRALVDGVVLAGAEIKDVLRAHGWSGFGLHGAALTDALHDTLGRLSEVEQAS